MYDGIANINTAINESNMIVITVFLITLDTPGIHNTLLIDAMMLG
ncbi:hypothetical protein PRUB_a0660 [Pseudoalteromonas rubra]|uniref:Uncharacterized protein n=1 Tax=Pseudoalteromonas rubra TaxID=43658 RepID=A0A8T0C6C2_9GAMM|nr:hypothetical protein PRUB_a0660 [Pseudoalteromonas rubra]